MPVSDFAPLFAIVPIIIGIGGMVVLAGMVTVIVLMVRNFRKGQQAGHDPLTLQAELAVKAMDSTLLAPARSIEDRLIELDRLHAQRTISAEEHATARLEILSGRS